MLKRMAMLMLAMMTGSTAFAQNSASIAAANRERPTSMDRNLAPDEYPTNVVKILRTTNKAQTNSYVPVVFTMRNNNPFNVIKYLLKPVQEEEGLMFTFVSPEGAGGKVLYVVPKYMIPTLEALVKSVDIPGLTTSAGDKRIYRQLKHRRADSSDQDFLDTAASFSTGNGSVFIADPENNALYWEDSPAGALALDGVLTSDLDKPTAMVQLLVKIYELNSYNDGTIGQDYEAWKNTLGQNLFVGGAYAEHGGIGRVDKTTVEPLGTGALGLPHNNFTASGYNYAYRYEMSSAFFDYLQSKGKSRLLNQSKLAALNSYPACLSAGDQVLYYAVQDSQPSGVRDTNNIFQANGGRTVVGTVNESNGSSLTPVETGLSLDFTPTIGTQSVKLDLRICWSDYTAFGADGFPQINPRKLRTTLRMAVNDEFVIGGLKRQVRVSNTEKAPFFGSLPVVGYMFGGETEANNNTEMVVAIQPIGIMNYDLAGGSTYAPTKAEQLVMDQATGKASVKLPETTWGFDQYGADAAAGLDLKGMN
jgi:type II secretory pathway component GspD/PulD (secretin)